MQPFDKLQRQSSQWRRSNVGSPRLPPGYEERRRFLELATIVHSSHDAIIGKTLNGIITSWNIGAEKMFGYTADEMIGTSIARIIHPDHPGEMNMILEKVRGGQRIDPFETVRVRRDGTPIYLSLAVSPIRDVNGHIVGLSSVGRDITERKLSEMSLKESEERFRSMANNAPVMIWMSESVHRDDVEGWFNDQWFTFTGCDRLEDAKTFWKQHVHPDDLPTIEQAYKAASITQKTFHAEYRFLNAHGEYRWLSDTATPRIRSDGVLIGYIGTCIDVTQQKETADALREQEVYYRTLAEAIPQIVWTARPDGYNDYYNQQWFRYTGLTERETYGPHKKSIVHPEDRERNKELWEQATRTGQAYEIEYRFLRTDGMYRWHLGRAIPIRDAHGKIIKWFGTCTDIHDQKEAAEKMRTLNEELETRVIERTEKLHTEIQERIRLEENARAQSERLKKMISNMELAAIAADENLVILHANQKFCTMFNLGDVNDILGKNGMEVLAKAKESIENGDFFAGSLLQIFETRQKDLNRELPLKNGRIVSVDYIPIFETGKHRGHLLLYRDITQEKRIDRTKSEFMSLSSHQLRTPLTSMRWMLGRLEKSLGDKADGYEKRLIGEGRTAVMRMAETINTMLMISRIESGKTTLKTTTFNLCGLLETMKNDYKIDYQTKKQKLSISCDQSIMITTDEGFLKEILKNLISNAVKYTPEGKKISVSVQAEPRALTIQVTDEGRGIPVSEQDKIFSKFFRATNVVVDDTNGTGLGLYLVHLISELLKGSVAFTSSEGKGTTFQLTLPK